MEDKRLKLAGDPLPPSGLLRLVPPGDARAFVSAVECRIEGDQLESGDHAGTLATLERSLEVSTSPAEQVVTLEQMASAAPR